MAAAFVDEMMGAESLWMVSVLRVGADDASTVKSDKLISPRMMEKRVSIGCFGCDGEEMEDE